MFARYTRGPFITVPLMYRATQYNDLSAGAACLSFVANLAGLPVSEHDLLTEVGGQPGVGADPIALALWCRANMPEQTGDCGEETYRGGVAVANVIDPVSQRNHYVVLLRATDDQYEYWCPMQGLVQVPRTELQWRSGNSEYREWAINFPKLAAPAQIGYLPRVWLVVGQQDSLADDNGLVFQMLHALKCYGVVATWHSTGELMLNGSTLWIAGVPVRPEDVVLARFGKRSQAQAADLLRVLACANTQFVNAPGGQLTWLAKVATVGLKREPSLIVTSAMEMRRAAEELFLRGHEYLAIRKPGPVDSQLRQRVRTLGEAERSFAWAATEVGYACVEPEGSPASARYQTRVLVAYGDVLAAVQGFFRDFTRVNLSAAQFSQVHKLLPALQRDGLHLVTVLLQGDEVIGVQPGDLALLAQLESSASEMSLLVEAIIQQHRLAPAMPLADPLSA